MEPEPQSMRRRVTIVNPYGLCLRPMNKFVKLAFRYQSNITVYYKDQVANGKSMLDLSSLAADRGETLEIEANGPDAEQALDALVTLVENGFYYGEEWD